MVRVLSVCCATDWEQCCVPRCSCAAQCGSATSLQAVELSLVWSAWPARSPLPSLAVLHCLVCLALVVWVGWLWGKCYRSAHSKLWVEDCLENFFYSAWKAEVAW